MSSSHLIRPDVDDVPLLANIAQILEQTDVTADPDEKMAIALQECFPEEIADEPASATTSAIAGRKATICTRAPVRCYRKVRSASPKAARSSRATWSSATFAGCSSSFAAILGPLVTRGGLSPLGTLTPPQLPCGLGGKPFFIGLGPREFEPAPVHAEGDETSDGEPVAQVWLIRWRNTVLTSSTRRGSNSATSS